MKKNMTDKQLTSFLAREDFIEKVNNFGAGEELTELFERCLDEGSDLAIEDYFNEIGDEEMKREKFQIIIDNLLEFYFIQRKSEEYFSNAASHWCAIVVTGSSHDLEKYCKHKGEQIKDLLCRILIRKRYTI